MYAWFYEETCHIEIKSQGSHMHKVILTYLTVTNHMLLTVHMHRVR